MSRSRLKKYYVTVSRLVTQETKFWVDAPDEETAGDIANDTAAEVAELVWTFTNDEPHTISVDNIQDGETVGKGVDYESTVHSTASSGPEPEALGGDRNE